MGVAVGVVKVRGGFDCEKVRHGLLQIAIGIINCDDYYKLRQYSSTEPVSRLPGVLQ